MFDVGIHLPQFGRASSPDAIARAARLAEDRGFAGLWVSDHLVQPASQDWGAPPPGRAGGRSSGATAST